MSDIYPVPENYKASAHLDAAGYAKAYAESVENKEAFWAETARRLDWFRVPPTIKDGWCDEADLDLQG